MRPAAATKGWHDQRVAQPKGGTGVSPVEDAAREPHRRDASATLTKGDFFHDKGNSLAGRKENRPLQCRGRAIGVWARCRGAHAPNKEVHPGFAGTAKTPSRQEERDKRGRRSIHGVTSGRFFQTRRHCPDSRSISEWLSPSAGHNPRSLATWRLGGSSFPEEPDEPKKTQDRPVGRSCKYLASCPSFRLPGKEQTSPSASHLSTPQERNRKQHVIIGATAGRFPPAGRKKLRKLLKYSASAKPRAGPVNFRIASPLGRAVLTLNLTDPYEHDVP